MVILARDQAARIFPGSVLFLVDKSTNDCKMKSNLHCTYTVHVCTLLPLEIKKNYADIEKQNQGKIVQQN